MAKNMTNGDRAQAKGYTAGAAGKPKSSNPHGVKGGVHARWLAGWTEGRADRKPKAKPTQRSEPAAPATSERMVVDTTLTLEYETKNSEYVFGDELADGFISVTLPKDRFVDKPTTIRVKIDLIS